MLANQHQQHQQPRQRQKELWRIGAGGGIQCSVSSGLTPIFLDPNTCLEQGIAPKDVARKENDHCGSSSSSCQWFESLSRIPWSEANLMLQDQIFSQSAQSFCFRYSRECLPDVTQTHIFAWHAAASAGRCAARVKAPCLQVGSGPSFPKHHQSAWLTLCSPTRGGPILLVSLPLFQFRLRNRNSPSFSFHVFLQDISRMPRAARSAADNRHSWDLAGSCGRPIDTACRAPLFPLQRNGRGPNLKPGSNLGRPPPPSPSRTFPFPSFVLFPSRSVDAGQLCGLVDLKSENSFSWKICVRIGIG